MANIASELQMIANEIVSRAQTKEARLKDKLRKIEAEKLQIEAELHATHIAPKRLIEFRPTLGPDYQCPHCFIKDETRSALRPIPGSQTHDLFRCSTCDAEFVFDA